MSRIIAKYPQRKILISGLDDKPEGEYRKLIYEILPKDRVVLFTTSKAAMGLLDVVDLVIVCHPILLRYIFKEQSHDKNWESRVHGLWQRDKDDQTWFYSTTKVKLKDDLTSLVRDHTSVV